MMAQFDERDQQHTDGEYTSQFDARGQHIRDQQNIGRDNIQHIHHNQAGLIGILILLVMAVLVFIGLWRYGYFPSIGTTPSIGGTSTTRELTYTVKNTDE